MADDKIVVQIGADVAGLKNGLAQAVEALAKLGATVDKLQTNTRETTESFSGFGAVLFGLQQKMGEELFDKLVNTLRELPKTLNESAERAAAFGSRMADMSLRVRMSTDALQKLSYAGALVGVDLSGITSASMMMERTLQGQPQKVESLGLSFSKFTSLNAEEKFLAVADALKKIENPTLQAARAYEIFGRQSKAVMALLREGTGSGAAAAGLGFLISEKDIQTADAYDDSLLTLRKTVEGFHQNVGIAVLNTGLWQRGVSILTEIVGAASIKVKEFGSWIKQLPEPLRTSIGLVGQLAIAIPSLAIGVGVLSAAWARMLPYIRSVIYELQFLQLQLAEGGIASLSGATKFGIWGAAAIAAGLAGYAVGTGIRYLVDEYLPSLSKWLDDVIPRLADFLIKWSAIGAIRGIAGMMKEKSTAMFSGSMSAEAFNAPKNQAAIQKASAAGRATLGPAEQRQFLKEGEQKELQLSNALLSAQSSLAGGYAKVAIQIQLLNNEKRAQLDTFAKEMAADKTGELRANQEHYRATIEATFAARAKLIQQQEADQSSARERAAQQELQMAVNSANKDINAQTDAIRIGLAFKLQAIAHDRGMDAAQREVAAGAAKRVAAQQIVNAETQHAIQMDGEARQAAFEYAEAEAALTTAVSGTQAALQEQLDAITRSVEKKKEDIDANIAYTDTEVAVKQAEVDRLAILQKLIATKAFGRDQDQRAMAAGVEMAERSKQAESLNLEVRQRYNEATKNFGDMAAMRVEQIGKETAALILQARKVAVVTGDWERYLKTLAQLTDADKKLKGIAEGAARVEKTLRWTDTLGKVLDMFDLLGISANTTFGQIMAGARAAIGDINKFAQAKNKMEKAAAIGSAAINIFKSGGEKGAVAGAAHGALSGAGIGFMIGGPVGAGIGAALGGIIGILGSVFGKPEWKKTGEAAGKILGFAIGDETSKAIQATMDKLHLNVTQATLLNIGKIAADANKSFHDMGGSVLQLMQGVADGTIPLKQGTEAIAEAWSNVRSEAEAAGTVGDSLTVQMLKMARASNSMTQEMKDFVDQSLATAISGIDKLVPTVEKLGKRKGAKTRTTSGLDYASYTGEGGSAASATAMGNLFATVFWATVKEKGLVAAADAMREQFDRMKESFKGVFSDEDSAKMLEPIQRIMDLTAPSDKDSSGLFRGAAEAAQGLADAMKGVADAGYLMQSDLADFGVAAKTAFDQAVKGGATNKEALAAMMPYLQNAVSAAKQYGYELDGNTAAMVKQAEEAGFTFPTDPLLIVVDLLSSIATKLGAEIPESAKKAGDGVDSAMGGAARETREAAAEASASVGEVLGKVKPAAEATSDFMKQTLQHAMDATTTSVDGAVTTMSQSVDSLVEHNALGAQESEQSWAGAFQKVPILLEGMEGDWTEGFNGLADAAAPGLSDVKAGVNGIKNALDGITSHTWTVVVNQTGGKNKGDDDDDDSGDGNGGGGGGGRRRMAKGGYVPPRQGGTRATLGEGGEGEYVVPESKINKFMSSVGGRQAVSITHAPTIHINGSGLDEDRLLRVVDRALRNNRNELRTRVSRIAQGKE